MYFARGYFAGGEQNTRRMAIGSSVRRTDKPTLPFLPIVQNMKTLQWNRTYIAQRTLPIVFCLPVFCPPPATKYSRAKNIQVGM